MTIFLYTFVEMSGTRANMSKLFCRSFALSLDKMFGSVKSGKTYISRLAVALTLHYLCE